MRCPRCQQENPGHAKFCHSCGRRLELTCPNCARPTAPGSRFCNECGRPIPPSAGWSPVARFASPGAYTPRHLAEKILSSKASLEGERKHVTVIFADLNSSMELVLADRDPEEARRLLDAVLEHMIEAVHRYEGTVNQVMGDGIMALFGAPVAHEDHAVRACYAALAMQTALRRHAEEVRRTHGIALQIRIGLNAGEVVVRAIDTDLHMDYSAVGQTTHLAARMERLASPGSIVLTADTLRLVEGYVEVRPLGPVPIKGLQEPIEIYEVIGASAVRSRLQATAARGLTRFVGRGGELDQLRRGLERARGGHGQVVAVMGELGVGKSRLYWEFTHSHRTQGWLILESGSVSYGRATAYLPVIDLLRAYFQLEHSDDARKVREKVTGKLLALDRSLEPTLPAFFTLLEAPVDDARWEALDPSQRRQWTLDAVKRLLLRESQLQPLLLVFEDLHWIDSETQAILDTLVESLPTSRILLLVNYRPEYAHAWASKTYYTQLRIDPLAPESAEELLHALLGGHGTLSELKQLLIERTEGNPFFLEESVRALVETRVLVGERGAYRLATAVPSIQVPASVQSVLAARIDRLPPEEKRLLQCASVIGKHVPFTLLQAISDLPEDELRRDLGYLQSAEFLYEATLFPELEYTFKHALTHEVAYQSLLKERQRALHARIVSAIETLYADRLSEQVERLAHHALHGAVAEKAVLYLRQAGAKAVARSADREAVGLFEQALMVLEHLPETRETLTEALDIRIALGPALMAVKGSAHPEVEASYTRARELCSRIDDTWSGGVAVTASSRLFPVLWGLWHVNDDRGQHQQAQKLGERLLGVAETCQDSAMLLQAHHALWATLFAIGQPAAAHAHVQQGLALYDPRQHRSHASLYGGHDPGVCCRCYSALTLWELGYPDQALRAIQEALSLARELSHPLTSVIAMYFAAWVHYHRGENHAAAEMAEAAVALATPHGFSPWLEDAARLRSCLTIEPGRGQTAIARLPSAAAVGPAGRESWREVFSLCLLARAYGALDQSEKALAVLSEAVAMAEKHIEGFYEPELYRLKGELLLTQTGEASQDAETRFRGAIELARTRQKKSMELRAATSLGRLLARQGRRDEARRALAGIYGSFSEGFGTRDLKEAGALLDELKMAADGDR